MEGQYWLGVPAPEGPAYALFVVSWYGDRVQYLWWNQYGNHGSGETSHKSFYRILDKQITPAQGEALRTLWRR